MNNVKWTAGRALGGNEATMKPVLCCRDPFRIEAQISPAAERWPLRAQGWPLGTASPEAIPLLGAQYSCLVVDTSAEPPQLQSSTWGQLEPLFLLHHSSVSPSASPAASPASFTPQLLILSTLHNNLLPHQLSFCPGEQICNREMSRGGICEAGFQFIKIN